MQDILLFPYSGTAIEALDCLGSDWSCVGFISDDSALVGQEKFGIKIFGRRAFSEFPYAKVLAVNGSPSSYLRRASIVEDLKIDLGRFATVMHPKATISPLAQVGRNVLIMAGVVITANAVIENHVVILPNSVVHHDSYVGEYTLIAANTTIAGNVKIGKCCYLGASCTIKNGVHIPDKTLVGMGANVVNSIEDPAILVGNPARPLVKEARKK
jgi:sugar O-acyltransferase (sialic acid O-acetyltransferase NeuD family)